MISARVCFKTEKLIRVLLLAGKTFSSFSPAMCILVSDLTQVCWVSKNTYFLAKALKTVTSTYILIPPFFLNSQFEKNVMNTWQIPPCQQLMHKTLSFLENKRKSLEMFLIWVVKLYSCKYPDIESQPCELPTMATLGVQNSRFGLIYLQSVMLICLCFSDALWWSSKALPASISSLPIENFISSSW